jgi:diacylglycerol kinase (ATP)
MTAKVILNPYAGRWKALKSLDDIKSSLHDYGVDYELVMTEGPGHGIKLAKEAVLNGYNPIVSAGGDGSVSEVVNGVAQVASEAGEKSQTSVGILPLGTANDLAINLELPLDLNNSAKVISHGYTKNMDLGFLSATTFNQNTRIERYFDNLSGIGLESHVTVIQKNLTKIRGVIRYLVAAFIGIAQNPQWTMTLEWEGGSFSGPVTLVAVGNNPLTGGLFYMTPHANPFDGLLTFVYGFMSTRVNIMRLLPRTMKPGKGSYIEHPEINEIHSTWLRVNTDQPAPLHADGEIQSEEVKKVDYQILPEFIPILLEQDLS